MWRRKNHAMSVEEYNESPFVKRQAALRPDDFGYFTRLRNTDLAEPWNVIRGLKAIEAEIVRLKEGNVTGS